MYTRVHLNIYIIQKEYVLLYDTTSETNISIHIRSAQSHELSTCVVVPSREEAEEPYQLPMFGPNYCTTADILSLYLFLFLVMSVCYNCCLFYHLLLSLWWSMWSV